MMSSNSKPRWTWEVLEAAVTVIGKRRIFSDEQCKWAANESGLRVFPPSYVELMSHFGAGEWYPDFFIACPAHEMRTATIAYSISKARSIFKELISGKVAMQQQEVLNRLIVFGGNGAGFDLCWDPARK